MSIYNRSTPPGTILQDGFRLGGLEIRLPFTLSLELLCLPSSAAASATPG